MGTFAEDGPTMSRRAELLTRVSLTAPVMSLKKVASGELQAIMADFRRLSGALKYFCRTSRPVFMCSSRELNDAREQPASERRPLQFATPSPKWETVHHHLFQHPFAI
jgi:hypothetical protein